MHRFGICFGVIVSRLQIPMVATVVVAVVLVVVGKITAHGERVAVALVPRRTRLIR